MTPVKELIGLTKSNFIVGFEAVAPPVAVLKNQEVAYDPVVTVAVPKLLAEQVLEPVAQPVMVKNYGF